MNFRKSIEAAEDLLKEPVEIPAWPQVDDDGKTVLKEDGTPNCTYYVRMMNLGERQAFDMAVAVKRGDTYEMNPQRVRAELLVRTLCDDKGVRLFSDAEIGVVEGKGGDPCSAAFTAAQSLNGLNGAAVKN